MIHFPRKQGVVKGGLINSELWRWLTREISANTKNNGPAKFGLSRLGWITTNPILTLPTAPEVWFSPAHYLYPAHQLWINFSEAEPSWSHERTMMRSTTTQKLAQLLAPPLLKMKQRRRSHSNWVAHGWSFLAGAQYGGNESQPLRITPVSLSFPHTAGQLLVIWWYSAPKKVVSKRDDRSYYWMEILDIHVGEMVNMFFSHPEHWTHCCISEFNCDEMSSWTAKMLLISRV